MEADAGVNDGVANIGGDESGEVEERSEEDGGLDHREVGSEDGAEEHVSEAGNPEKVFDHE